MRKAKFQRVASLALALLVLVGSFTVAVSGEELETTAGNNNSVTPKTIADYKEELESISYSDYEKEFKAYAKAEKTITVNAIDALDMEKTTARYLTDEEWAVLSKDTATLASQYVGIYKTEYDGVKALYTPGDEKVTFKVSGVTEGLYCIRLNYYPVEGRSASIERELYINGSAPFTEARALTMAKVWENEYTTYTYVVPKKGSADEIVNRATALGIQAVKGTDEEGNDTVTMSLPEVITEAISAFLFDELEARFFTTDIDRNEIRPATVQKPKWCTYELSDSQGKRAESFQFILTPDAEGNVYLTFKGVIEPMAISTIELVPQEYVPTYEEYKTKYAGEKNGTSVVKIEAENPTGISANTVYPVEDRASAATSPSDTTRQVLNTIGGEKWQTPGQALYYTFQVEESGMYSIDMRFKQDVLDGLFVSRALSLYSDGLEAGAKGYYNGYPFKEAAQIRFNYSGYWQSTSMTDGSKNADGDPIYFQFYLEAGVAYTMKLEVTLGTMSEIIENIQNSLNAINSDYLSILRLTGSSPDDYRDYNFTRIMPQVLADMVMQSSILDTVATNLKEIAGTASSTVATLVKVSKLLYRMHDEDEIARNLSNLKTNIGSLGTFLSDAKTQPLQLDYIMIEPVESELPVAEPNFFRKLAHEIASFFQSFVRDYNQMGAMEQTGEEALEVWVAYGRDQSQVIRNLITNDFTPSSGISVDLKLVSGGTLLPSILAGVGPDVYIGVGAGDVINWAIRGALATLDVDEEGNKREDFEEVTQNFTDAAMLVLGIENSEGEMHYYALPETQGFAMMFCRLDVLSNLNIDIPKTWEDIYMAQTILEGNNMGIGLTTDYKIFLYQSGGDLFADGGMRINLDSTEGLLAFETMCSLFTMRSFDYQYDAANRFRSGEMPIVIGDYTGLYNQLKVFATEIDGLWEFFPMPGMEDENGNINNCIVSGVSADIIVKGTDKQEEAWEYLKWFTGASCQTDYANNMQAIMGDSAKHPTANREALASMPWTTEEYAEVQRQFNNLAAVPNYPGAYYIDRYTNFAFLAAYNQDADPSTQLLSYINTINKEITRKRKEFELETLEVGQTLADKRCEQAEVAFALLEKAGDTYNATIDMARIAIQDSNINILESCGNDLMKSLNGKDAASYTVKVFKQDQEKKNGGYDIDDLSADQLLYFAAECLLEAAAALATY